MDVEKSPFNERCEVLGLQPAALGCAALWGGRVAAEALQAFPAEVALGRLAFAGASGMNNAGLSG